jgi:biopolymer transport protein ExbB
MFPGLVNRNDTEVCKMDIINTALGFFQAGGIFMYPIVLILAIGTAIAIERYIYLNLVRVRNRNVWKRVLPLLEAGNYDNAREFTLRSNAAMSRILAYGLSRAKSSDSSEQVQMAMEEGLLEVVPRIEKRTHYLANIATLLGLLGTIIGLTEAFSAVSGAQPADKANLLSASISVAMNTTAFGLMVAIPLLLVHAFMQTKAAELVDSLEMATVRLSNLLTAGSATQQAAS